MAPTAEESQQHSTLWPPQQDTTAAQVSGWGDFKATSQSGDAIFQLSEKTTEGWCKWWHGAKAGVGTMKGSQLVQLEGGGAVWGGQVQQDTPWISYLGPSPGWLCRSDRVKWWTPPLGAWSSLCWQPPADPRVASRVAPQPVPGCCCWTACQWKCRPVGELEAERVQVRVTYT